MEISKKGLKKRKLIVDDEEEEENQQEEREPSSENGNDSEVQESPFSPPEAEQVSEGEQEAIEMDETENKDDFSDNEKESIIAPLKRDKKKAVSSKTGKSAARSNYHPIKDAGWKFGTP